jgi:hypothetical protein
MLNDLLRPYLFEVSDIIVSVTCNSNILAKRKGVCGVGILFT